MNPPIRLFDLPDLRADEPEPPPMSYGRRLKARNERLLGRGVHPATHQPLFIGTGERCKGCAFATPTGRGRKTYWKCLRGVHGLMGLSRGPRTDIRLKWPACAQYVANDEGTGVPSAHDRPDRPSDDGGRCAGCGREDALDQG